MTVDSQSRWSEIRLIVQRPLGGFLTYAVVERTVVRGVRTDKLIARGHLPIHAGSDISRSAWCALAAAWRDARPDSGEDPL